MGDSSTDGQVIKCKYAMLISNETQETLMEDLFLEQEGVRAESKKIKEKIFKCKLNPNERKKVTSKK